MIARLVKRKVTTSMIFLGVCLLGIISLQKLQVQLLPNIEFPKLTIITPYLNAAPSEIETLITRQIEEAVGSVNGVASIYSESIEGLSLVTATFNWGVNMDMALVETKEKVDMIKGQLPQDTEKSIVVKYDPREEPVMIYTIVNKKGDFKRVRKRIEKEIVPFIERIDGVATVDVTGGYKRQINIDLDSAKIYSHNLSLNEVMQQVNISNYNFPAGNVEKGNKEYLVRTIGEFKTVNEINKVVVGRNQNGVPIYLESIATITDSYKDRKSLIRLNGKESISLLIRKEPGKNTVAVCKRVARETGSLAKKYQKEFSIQKIYDQSDFITSSINNVFNSAIIGGIIAILILCFFLKEFRSPLIIATTIPVSVIGTFALMYFKGVSLNTMSLGGLALGVGMMVDSAIVVLESISHTKAKSENSENIINSIIYGTKQVIAPVISSILTTVVVFLPIVFLSGLSGAIFSELALTISFALLFSLITSITLIPMISTIPFFRRHPDKPWKIFAVSDKLMRWLDFRYYKAINFALKHKYIIMLFGIVTMCAGVLLFGLVKTRLMPSVDPGEFSIHIEAPQGTTLAESSALSYRVENNLLKRPYVKYVYAKVGSDPEENIAEKTSGKRANNISIKVLLKKNRESIDAIVSQLKKEIKFGDSINVDYEIKENVIASLIARKRKPLHVEIYGRDIDRLKASGEQVQQLLAKVPGVRTISSIFDKKDPELKVKIDRNKIAMLGVNIADVAATIKAAIHGEAVTKFREKDDEIDIRVRLKKSDRTEKAALYKILVKSEAGATVPISKFAEIVEGHGSSKLIRNEQSRVNIITADITGNKEDILSTVDSVLSRFPFPNNQTYKIIDEKTEITTTFKEMRFALVLAIILIYMLLASEFQSYKNPLIVMLSIPVTIIGVSGSLLLTGKTLNINSGIGIIMLAGIVVNNAIVLFDHIEHERRHGSGLTDSIVEAGMRRLKPILMTTLTTIFALVPIALGLGEGAELQQPMAIAVIGGLLVSTFLTLIYIPTIYAILNKKKK